MRNSLILPVALFTITIPAIASEPTPHPATAPTSHPALPKVDRALGIAIRDKDIKQVKKLLDAGSPVNADGDAPLTIAVLNGDIEMARLLLDRGANPDSWYGDDGACPALDCAARMGNVAMAELLLKRGARNGLDTAFWNAGARGNTKLLLLLIAHGADVNSKNRGGNTALNVAALYGQMESVRELLRAGADPAIANKKGETPLQQARREGHGDIADLIASFKRDKTPQTQP